MLVADIKKRIADWAEKHSLKDERTVSIGHHVFTARELAIEVEKETEIGKNIIRLIEKEGLESFPEILIKIR